MSQNGKGDSYRPTSKEDFDKNYERIFQKTNQFPSSSFTSDEYVKDLIEKSHNVGIDFDSTDFNTY